MIHYSCTTSDWFKYPFPTEREATILIITFLSIYKISSGKNIYLLKWLIKFQADFLGMKKHKLNNLRFFFVKFSPTGPGSYLLFLPGLTQFYKLFCRVKTKFASFVSLIKRSHKIWWFAVCVTCHVSMWLENTQGVSNLPSQNVAGIVKQLGLLYDVSKHMVFSWHKDMLGPRSVKPSVHQDKEDAWVGGNSRQNKWL